MNCVDDDTALFLWKNYFLINYNKIYILSAYL